MTEFTESELRIIAYQKEQAEKAKAKPKPPVVEGGLVIHEAKPTFVVNNNPSLKSMLKVKRASEYESKRLEYLLYPYFPSGTFSIVAGDEGSTKTWLSLFIATIIANGQSFITDTPFDKRLPGNVVYQSKENDMERDIRPRLDIMGTDLERILVIQDKDENGNGMPLTLTDGRIEQAIIEYRPRAVIFDPVQSYIGAKVEMNAANEVRPILDEIMRLANTYDTAFIVVMHLNKAATQNAKDRILGSTDFKAAARSIVIIGSDPEDPERRVMAHAKLSGGRRGESIAYRIDGEKGLVIEGFTDLKADDIIGSRQSRDGGRDKPSLSLDEAISFLIESMPDGYAKKEDIEAKAVQCGIKNRTLYNAKKELGIKGRQDGFNSKVTYWYFPSSEHRLPHKGEQLPLENTS